MTKLLERAVAKARSLTEEEQDAIASIIFEELKDETRWDHAFSKSQDVLAKMAAAAMEEDERGETKELDLDSL